MQNRALIIVLGALGVAYIGALVAIFIWYDGDRVIAATLISGAVGVMVPSLLGFKQSADNAVALKAVQADVADNTAVTETAKRAIGEVRQQAASTHLLVNGQSHEFRAALQEVAELKALVARLAGVDEGREEGRQIAIDLLAANAQPPKDAPESTP